MISSCTFPASAVDEGANAPTPLPRPPPPPSSRRGSTGACAACKFQRRRCMPDCLLAPLFPADQPSRFANAHRLFGVRNMERMVAGLHPRDRQTALQSLIYESEARARDPVGGCCRIICDLEAQIERKTAELLSVRQELQAMAAMAPSSQASDEAVAPPMQLPTEWDDELPALLEWDAEDLSTIMEVLYSSSTPSTDM